MQQSSEEVLQGFEPFGAQDSATRGSTLEHAFEELFVEHYPRLVKTLIRLTGDRGQSEELAAEAFCKLYKQRPPENSAGWVYKTALNLGLDALRANSRRVRREERAGREALRNEQAGGPLEDLLAEEQRGRVRAVIAQLKPVHGQVLLMGSSGFSGKEMASVLGLNPDALYMLVARAKAQFEKRYVQLYGRGVQR